MRKTHVLSIAFICLFLSACVSSLVIGNQLQSKLMWSLLKPLVGFDPNEVDLFETPMIKNPVKEPVWIRGNVEEVTQGMKQKKIIQKSIYSTNTIIKKFSFC